MADAHGQLGEYCKQKELSEFALLNEELAFGSGSLKLCSTLSTLAAAHRNLCNYGQQKKFLEGLGHLSLCGRLSSGRLTETSSQSMEFLC